VYLNTMFWASRLSPDYDIWLEWDYSRLSNGGFFMAPPEQDGRMYRIMAPNGYRGVVSAEAMGIICCLFTYSHLSFLPWFRPFASDHFHLLREYAGTHNDSRRIYAAID
jgi:Antirestriction protein